jgi:GNAT superfamily N-acetyltransferase
MATPGDIRVESLADHPGLFEQVGLLRWKEWAYGAPDPAPFIEITAREAGRSGQLPMTLVAIDVAGSAVGAVGLDRVDDELSAAERAGRTPWIVGMVVRAENRKQGVGRQLLESLRPEIRYIDLMQEGDSGQRVAGNIRFVEYGCVAANGEFTHVMVRLGTAELDIVDTLLAAGIANNRAEAIRCALTRIPERPDYEQLGEHARDIERLKSEF